MKKIIPFLVLLVCISCQYFHQLESDKELSGVIENEIANHREPINLATLTNFEWDNYLIIGPYSLIENVEKKYKIDLSNISENGIEYSDYYYILVFIKDKKSIKICELKKHGKLNEDKLLKEN